MTDFPGVCPDFVALWPNCAPSPGCGAVCDLCVCSQGLFICIHRKSYHHRDIKQHYRISRNVFLILCNPTPKQEQTVSRPDTESLPPVSTHRWFPPLLQLFFSFAHHRLFILVSCRVWTLCLFFLLLQQPTHSTRFCCFQWAFQFYVLLFETHINLDFQKRNQIKTNLKSSMLNQQFAEY